MEENIVQTPSPQNQPIQPPPAFEKPKSSITKFIPIIIIGLILLLVGLGGGYLLFGAKNGPEQKSNMASNITPTTTQSISPTEAMRNIEKNFISQNLGIAFDYKQEPFSDGTKVKVKESDNKVYVYVAREGSNTDYKTGQYVEIFQKDPGITLKEAIENKFLKGYSSNDCFVKNYDLNNPLPRYEGATISYPAPTDPNAAWFENGDKCPPVYSESNGLSYFFYDKNFPNKFAFFSIGQYPIESGVGNKMWQDTFDFIK